MGNGEAHMDIWSILSGRGGRASRDCIRLIGGVVMQHDGVYNGMRVSVMIYEHTIQCSYTCHIHEICLKTNHDV